MAVFFIFTVTLATVAAIVFFLRRQQTRATAEYAERHQPLPPLQPPELEPEREEEVAESSTPADAAPPPPRDWLKQCQSLRNEGRLDEAMALSEQALPQLQALEQQALIVRARLRDARQKNDEQATQHWVDALYQVAARASCLHDAPPPDRPQAPRRMADVMDYRELEAMDMPYEEIGHEKLKLLRKTDRQLLESLYGEPRRHISVREWLHQ